MTTFAHSAVIDQKRAELSRLEKRLDALISMRADGEIDKAQFLRMKSDVDDQMKDLQEQITQLLPPEDHVMELPDYDERLRILGNELERSLDFDTDEDIPEHVIEAFVEKIVVKADTFEWYLLYSGGGFCVDLSWGLQENPGNCPDFFYPSD